MIYDTKAWDHLICAGFHGRTIGVASVTSSNLSFGKHYAPFLPHVYFALYPYCFRCSFGQKVETLRLQCLDYLKEDFHYIVPFEDVSAVLFEPVMGEGGYIVRPANDVKALQRLCEELGILLIVDEVQAGLGRTGKLFASEIYNVVPDIFCMGKAVGGGFPLGIVASTKECQDGKREPMGRRLEAILWPVLRHLSS